MAREWIPMGEKVQGRTQKDMMDFLMDNLRLPGRSRLLQGLDQRGSVVVKPV
jgi:hypothetical protein